MKVLIDLFLKGQVIDMIGRRIVASKDVTIAEVSEILSKLGEEELGFEQSKTLGYSNKFKKLSKSDSESMIRELMENDKIPRTRAVKITDLLPQNSDGIKAIFAKETFSLSEGEITRIEEIVKKYMKETKKEDKEEKKEKKKKEEKEDKKEKEEKKE